MLNFYDFEVFSNDWLVVIINPILKTKKVIVNNRKDLLDYYCEHINEIWIGYNSRNYDQYILKSLLLDFNPKTISDAIILKGEKGYNLDRNFKKLQLFNYDVSIKQVGLKTLEGYMGNNIKECSVPFNLDRSLTREELKEVIEYCTNDVEQTAEIFLKRENVFNTQMDLIRTFNLSLDCVGKTYAQLCALILNASKRKLNDDWEIRTPENLKLDKYKFIEEWFLLRKNHYDESNLNCKIADVEHSIAWGGLHGARKNYSYTCKNDEVFILADVDQLYPTLMVKYNLLSRAVRKNDRYKEMLKTSLILKKENREKERELYKKICNIAYGAMGDEYNSMYDPLNRKLVCVYGQLFMIDLIEKIEGFAELVQSNTDGILIKIKNKDYDLLDDVVFEWEERTGLKMSFSEYKTVIQKDVSSYIAIDYDGNAKRIGEYVKEKTELDNDLPIVTEAVFKFLTENIPPERTIKNCNELKQFQKIVKLSKKYKYAYHNGERLKEKVFRVFASKDIRDSYIGKQKEIGATIEKFANTPANCFIDNGDVNGKEIPYKLDKSWYLELAKKRIADFGLKETNYEQMKLL